jgi:hypothetical protein
LAGEEVVGEELGRGGARRESPGSGRGGIGQGVVGEELLMLMCVCVCVCVREREREREGGRRDMRWVR